MLLEDHWAHAGVHRFAFGWWSIWSIPKGWSIWEADKGFLCLETFWDGKPTAYKVACPCFERKLLETIFITKKVILPHCNLLLCAKACPSGLLDQVWGLSWWCIPIFEDCSQNALHLLSLTCKLKPHSFSMTFYSNSFLATLFRIHPSFSTSMLRHSACMQILNTGMAQEQDFTATCSELFY